MGTIINLQQKQQLSLKVGIICQARMTSKRFPGKSMALLKEKPVLQWVLERALKIRGMKGAKAPKVVIAVPDTPESEPMLELSTLMGVDNFCGDEENVLSRYYKCALFHKFDCIVRITCDCPFIDPVVCSEVLQLLIWRKLDYVSNVFPKRTYPRGLDCEAFTFDTLEAAYHLDKTKEGKEHVTPWMQQTPEVMRANVVQKTDASHKNFCVDFPEDIERLEKELSTGTIIEFKGAKQ